MYLGQSSNVQTGTEQRHVPGPGGNFQREPVRHHGYQEREIDTGYGRSSGYADSDAYSGSKRYLNNEPRPLFRFS